MIMEALYLVWSLTLLINCNFCFCERLEPGILNITLNMDSWANRFGGLTKNLANGTDIAITVVDCVGEGKYTIEWIVRYTECNGLATDVSANITRNIEGLFDSGGDFWKTNEEDFIAGQRSNASNEMECQHDPQYLQDESGPGSFTCYPIKNDVEHCKIQGGSQTFKTKPSTQLTKPQLKRSPDELTPEPPTETPVETPEGRVTTITQPGRYWVVVHLTPRPLLPTELQVTLTINTRSPSGYLSALQAPLLPFYGVMCGFYSVLLIIWLVLLSLQWQNLLGIQFWIGGVMLLGLLVMAISCALFKTVNDYGVVMPGAAVVAELISCSKRSVARMLTLSVSLGHGVTRPNLGKDLRLVLGLGIANFCLGVVLSMIGLQEDNNKQHEVIAIFLISVLDAVICFCIFKSLRRTTRKLRESGNTVKLSLYQLFTVGLVVCIVASLIFLTWFFAVHRLTDCDKAWQTLWLNVAFWEIEFFLLLTFIAVLFRPTAFNQHHVLSFVTNRTREDDQCQQPMLNEAFEGMTMRNVSDNSNQESQMIDKDYRDNAEDEETTLYAKLADTVLVEKSEDDDLGYSLSV